MNGDLSIDIASAIPYAVDRVLSLFGRDELTVAAKDRLAKRIRVSVEQAATVQCVGMARPIPIAEIYQETLLRSAHRDPSAHLYRILSLIERSSNAIIFGGPGAGKTVLIHWAFLHLLRPPKRNTIPVLFTLRSPGAVDDLRSFVSDLAGARILRDLRDHVVLLVDGYDEVSLDERRSVSQSLREFKSLARGPFYLTCRLYYTIIDLDALYLYIAPFDELQAQRFIDVFFRAYGLRYDGAQLIHELRARGFADFLSSPLMLTLVCILKTGSLPQLPRNSIGLLRRAIETLTFRWDEGKGIARTSRVGVDGEERVRCLMRIAFEFDKPSGPESTVLRCVQEHLRYIQRSDVSPSRLLDEIAQWYGLLVPTSGAEWTFAHRTVHDFLAARFWVESGAFSADAIAEPLSSSRAAYAACLVPNATQYIVSALEHLSDMEVLAECLGNNAAFDPDIVAAGVVRYYERHGRTQSGLKAAAYHRSLRELDVSVEHDFFALASDVFLDALARAGGASISMEHDVVLALALSELLKRGHALRVPVRGDAHRLRFTVTRGGATIGPFRTADLHAGQPDRRRARRRSRSRP